MIKLDTEQIKQIIPHRDPFLWIREVTLTGDGQCEGLAVFEKGNAIFLGHFPDYPVVPGVLLIEAMAQTGAAALLSRPEHKGKIALLCGVDGAKFSGAVRPDDEVRITVCETNGRMGIYKCNAEAQVGGRRVCSCTITCAVTDKK